MLGKQHISISAFTALIIVTPLILFISSDTSTIPPIPYIAIFIYMFGVITGSLLPDSDASDTAARHKLSMLPFYIVNRYIVYPILRYKYHEDREHRGIMHTVIGVAAFTVSSTLLMLVMLLAINYFEASLLSEWIIGICIAFGIGIFIGGCCHLLEDMCTVSGIKPFGNIKYHGGVSTGNKWDFRPALLSGSLMVVWVVLLAGGRTYNVPVIEMIPVCIVAVVFMWVVFLFICNVRKG